MTTESYGRIFFSERNAYPEEPPNQRKDSHV